MLVVMIAGAGLMRFPITEDQARRARRASGAINAKARAVVDAAATAKAVG